MAGLVQFLPGEHAESAAELQHALLAAFACEPEGSGVDFQATVEVEVS